MDTMSRTNGAYGSDATIFSQVVWEAEHRAEASHRGHGLADGRQTAENWREAALNDVLYASRFYDETSNALLLAIRRNQPERAAVTLWAAQAQVMRFLQEKTQNLRSLLDSSTSTVENENIWPYMGWFGCEWEGIEIEVAIDPSMNSHRYLICTARDEAGLHRFAQTLVGFAEQPVGRCLRYSEGWESAPDLDAELGKVSWSDIILKPEILSSVRKTVENFFSERESFHKLGFAWRRGMLLVGPPGTGKTMICKAVATALPELPFLYVRDMRDHYSGEAIKQIFTRARRLAPCILAFEDLDGLVGEDTRTRFLNEMDGFGSNEGIFVIASSNHPEKIDQALLKRPSRFDRVFVIGLPEQPEREAYCLSVLERSSLSENLHPSLDRQALARAVGERSGGFTPAFIKEAITAAALERAQDGAIVLDDKFGEALLAQVDELQQHIRRLKNVDGLAVLTGGDGSIGLRR